MPNPAAGTIAHGGPRGGRSASPSAARPTEPVAATRLVVLAAGLVLCLIGFGGLAMNDMGTREVGSARFTTPAVVQAATGVDREVAFPSAVAGAFLALGLSVTFVVARRPTPRQVEAH